MVALVLVGVGLGEGGDRAIEPIRGTQVARDPDRVGRARRHGPREAREQKKSELDARTAKARADDAEAYATYAIDLAYSAVAEAEYAVLDAVLASKEADELS